MNTLFAAVFNSTNEIGFKGPTKSIDVKNDILYPVYFWAGIVAVIVIIVAGFFYVTSQGEAQNVVRAKNAILSAIIGLAIIMGAFVITKFVVGGL
ncbi:MAG: hypothetical protein KA069_00060 [Candidatus Saccharimonas sp.]|jgi:hypothetical protein|nr:hypothetical protein [Candidatus Saccharimonas sp.]QQS68750.1 MAG: hypothetical protein IPP24_01825 [Candidatus Saccharibacteria bacterium]